MPRLVMKEKFSNALITLNFNENYDAGIILLKVSPSDISGVS